MTKRIELTMAQAILKFLDNQYVELDSVKTKYVNGMFGIFGHGCVTGVGQALAEDGHGITFYQGHSEQGMAHAATAFAKQKNRREIIPCLTSVGPGALNMVTAAGTATANRIPLLLFPGDTFACRQPDPVLQQSEIFSSYLITVNDAFKPVCRYFDRVTRPEQIMTALINAMRVLTDPADTGAVCIAMPQDVEAEKYAYPEYFFEERVWHMDRRPLTERQLEDFCNAIKSSKSPLILCGGGVKYSEAGDALIKFAEKFNIPICETQAGKGEIPWNHPLNVGGVGVTGCLAANKLAKGADLVIGLGTRFTDFTTCSKWGFQNPDVKIVAVNICPFDAFKMDAIPIISDCKEALIAATKSKLLSGYKSAYTNEILNVKTEWNAIVDNLYTKNIEKGLAQTFVLGELNRVIDKSSVIVAAAGSLPGDLQRIWRSEDRGTYHVEYGFSCMGYEICGALGAKMAEPNREIYAMVGDGSYLMLHSELYTAIQEGIKINVVLFDNSGWGCIESLQNNQGSETFGTVFKARNPKTGKLNGRPIPIDFSKNAESYGCKTYVITDLLQLKDAIEDAKKQTVSVLFDIKVAPKTFTPGYESWWRVGVASVSSDRKVKKAYKNMVENIAKTRDY